MPVIRRKWTNKYGFRFWFVLKGKCSPRFPTEADAQAGLRAAQANLKDPAGVVRDVPTEDFDF